MNEIVMIVVRFTELVALKEAKISKKTLLQFINTQKQDFQQAHLYIKI